jgi:eukaryotic-like serine/threonine-protein kinase
MGYVGESFVFAPLAFSSDGEVLYFGAADGIFYAVNSTSGIQKWNYTTTSPIVTGATVTSDGVIMFGSIDGNFYALNSSGKRRWKTSVSSRSNTPAIGMDYF